jgi:type II secretory pathway component PulF
MANMSANDEIRHWRYVGETVDGRTIRGQVDGRNEEEALSRVRALGATPIELAPAIRGNSMFSDGRTELSSAEALVFVRGLADLVEAGIPVRDALICLSDREKRPVLKGFIDRLETRVGNGDPLSKALQEDVAQPPRLLIALVSAGEASGLLGENLVELARQMDGERELRQELIGQLVYPIALVVMIILTLVFLSYFVLPQFESIFDDARATPPAITLFVFEVGQFMRNYAVWIPAGFVLVLVALRTIFRQFEAVLSGITLRIPVFGTTIFKLESARYCRTLGLLLASGSALSNAERVARMSVGSVLLKRRHDLASEEVRAGVSLSSALEKHGAIPSDALRFVELGERTGRLDVMLGRAATLYDGEVRNTLRSAVDLIGPLMIAILGLCVGGVIAAIMLGVLSLNDVAY